MKFNFPWQKLILAFVSLTLALTVLVFPVSNASAGDNGPITPIPGLGRVPNITLQRMYQRERAWFDSQYQVVRDAYQLSKAFQKLIDIEKKRGRDVTALQDALSAFDTEIEVARTIHTEAGRIMGVNAGFNFSGEVVDRQAAGQTFLAARANLRDAHFRMVTAMDGLERIYKHWRSGLRKK